MTNVRVSQAVGMRVDIQLQLGIITYATVKSSAPLIDTESGQSAAVRLWHTRHGSAPSSYAAGGQQGRDPFSPFGRPASGTCMPFRAPDVPRPRFLLCLLLGQPQPERGVTAWLPHRRPVGAKGCPASCPRRR